MKRKASAVLRVVSGSRRQTRRWNEHQHLKRVPLERQQPRLFKVCGEIEREVHQTNTLFNIAQSLLQRFILSEELMCLESSTYISGQNFLWIVAPLHQEGAVEVEPAAVLPFQPSQRHQDQELKQMLLVEYLLAALSESPDARALPAALEPLALARLTWPRRTSQSCKLSSQAKAYYPEI